MVQSCSKRSEDAIQIKRESPIKNLLFVKLFTTFFFITSIASKVDFPCKPIVSPVTWIARSCVLWFVIYKDFPCFLNPPSSAPYCTFYAVKWYFYFSVERKRNPNRPGNNSANQKFYWYRYCNILQCSFVFFTHHWTVPWQMRLKKKRTTAARWVANEQTPHERGQNGQTKNDRKRSRWKKCMCWGAGG